MSITPDQFLTFAESSLASSSAGEFEFRNAASRAYYSAFHCCLAERQRCPNLKDSDIFGSHDRLYARYRELSNGDVENKLKSMAYMAQMMKSVRHEADYKLNLPFQKRDADQQVSDAGKILKSWKEINS